MGPQFGRILSGKKAPIKASLVLVLACIIVMTIPASAETPTLHFQGTDLAPGFIYLGDAHVEEMNDIIMLQVTITTNSEGVNLRSIIIHRTGLASDADVDDICLYEDINHNGTLDLGIDMLLSTANFELGRAEFSVPLTVNETNPLTLLVALNISSEATSGGTIGVEIPNESYIDTEGTADIEFEFPIFSKNSTLLLDTDGDLNPDTSDPDDDNDGYTDEREMLSGSDTKDPTSVPVDTDGDYVPDSIDTDDDNDGVPDKWDDFPLDASRQRDYTVIYIYAVVAAVLIIILIFLGFKGKPKSVGIKALSEEESEDEFDIGGEEEEFEGGEEELDTEEELFEDDELLEE